MSRGALMILIYASAASLHTPARGQTTTAAHGDSTLPPVPLMRCQQPQPTKEALIAHLAGLVSMSLTIDDDGMPNDIHVTNPLGLGLDESAISCMGKSRYSPAQRDGKTVPVKTNVTVGFQDRGDSDWHLAKIVFRTPEGATRPVFIQAKYPDPSGDKRSATVCVHLTIDHAGIPGAIQVASPRDSKLDKQAIAIANAFRFKPGSKDGLPVDVPATLDLVHGSPARIR